MQGYNFSREQMGVLSMCGRGFFTVRVQDCTVMVLILLSIAYIARSQESASPLPAPTVYEGNGVGALRLGDPKEKIEQLFGIAESASESHRWYTELGVYIQLYEDKVYTISFHEEFTGKLHKSGLGVGDSLVDLERAYGRVLERRKVPDHHGWLFDRILFVRRDGPQTEGGEASKVDYFDLGMRFFLDENERIMHFQLSHIYAPRRSTSRNESRGNGSGMPKGTPDERLARWKAARIQDWSVWEGVGFGPLQFGDLASMVEDVLGPPDSASDKAWRYRELGLTIALDDGRISAFFFHRGQPDLYYTGSFPGQFQSTEVGVGSRLEDVESLYGVALDRREVDSIAESVASRVLLVCRGCTAYSKGESSRLNYRDIGVYFDFDDDERVFGFGLNRSLLDSQGKDK